MRVFRGYLAKEWRDHRAVVLGILVAAPALVLLARWTLPPAALAARMTAPIAAVACLAVAALAFAGDLVPGERRRGRLGFLLRVPGGLAPAFGAKLAFLALAATLLPAYGWAVGGALTRFPGGEVEGLSWLLAAGALVTAWMFAVSCWLPRGALTLPSSALVLLLIAGPLAWIAWAARMPPTEAEIAGLLRWGTVAALLVACVSFLGLRRGPLAAAGRGLLATALYAAPAWAYAGLEARAWTTLDPLVDGASINDAILSRSGRFAYLNLRKTRGAMSPGTTHAVRVDLETGAWTRHGGPGNRWRALRPRPSAVALDDGRVFDAETFERGVLPGAYVSRQGAGWMSWGDGTLNRYFDPSRGKTYAPERLPGIALIRPGPWVVRSVRQAWLYDPDTQEILREVDLPPGPVCAVVGARGWLVMLERKTGDLVALDPESGERRVLVAKAQNCWGGPSLYRVGPHGGQRWMLLDPEGLAVHFYPAGPFRPVTEPQGTTVLGVVDGVRLAEIDLATGAEKVLFPR